MNKSRIVVVGSTNMDMVVKSNHIPVPGETVLGGGFLMNLGGKGANQAVSVARLGAEVTFISKVGNDLFGRQALQAFEEEGIEASGVLCDETVPSGVALITVDASGENSIVVSSGANSKLRPEDVEKCLEKISDVAILLIQLEIPLETVKYAVQYASSHGIKVILNPAPASLQLAELFKMIDIITPNTHEAEVLTGIAIKDADTAKQAAQLLYQQGVKNVVITLGAKGAVLLQEGSFYVIPPTKVEVVDSTAAGDVFNGVLAVALSEGKDVLAAVQLACQAASITTTRMGAQVSIPFRKDLNLDTNSNA